MKLVEAKRLIDMLMSKWPDQEVRLSFPITPDDLAKLEEIRGVGFFAHVEGSAYADIELVVRDGDAGPTRDETPPS